MIGFLLTIEASCELMHPKSEDALFPQAMSEKKSNFFKKRAKISMKDFECGFNGILWLGL